MAQPMLFPAPVEKPRTARDWFDTYFQAINPSNMKADDENDSPKPRKIPETTKTEK